MRRTIVATAALALGLGVGLTTAPSALAAGLRPGRPTNITVSINDYPLYRFANGNVTVRWKPPRVVRGHTGRATSYVVRCGTHRVTTSRTWAVVRSVATRPTSVVCGVQAMAGRLGGALVHAKPVPVYTARGAIVFSNFTAFSIAASRPGANWSGNLWLPLTQDPGKSTASVIDTYGSISLNGAPLTHVSVSIDPASTDISPIIDVSATTDAGTTISMGTAQKFDPKTGMWVMYSPTDSTSLAWFAAQNINFAPGGEAYGGFGMLLQADL